jgi:hypothetical protein
MTIRKEIQRELTRLLRDAVKSAQNPNCPEHKDALTLFRGGKAYGTVTIDYLKSMLGREPINNAYETLIAQDKPEMEIYMQA